MKTSYQKLFAILFASTLVTPGVLAVEVQSKKEDTNPVATVVEAPFKAAEGLVSGAFDLGNLIIGGKRLGSPFSEHVSKSVASTSVVTEQEINNAGVTTVPEAILKSPGFAFSDLNGNSEEPSLEVRGLRVGSDFVFMLDGVKLNEPKSGNVNFPLVPLNLVEQIEISRGGTSSLYGEGARGGAINVVPKKATQEGFHSTVETMAGSYDSWGENFESFYKDGFDNLYITGELYHTRGFRQNTSVEKENFYTKYVRDLSDTTQAGISYLYAQADLGRSGSIRESLLRSQGREATERPHNRAELDTTLITGQVNSLIMENLALSANTYLRQSHEISIVNFATFENPDNLLDLTSDIWGTTVQLDHSKPIFNDWVESLLIGVDYIDNEIDEEDYSRSKYTETIIAPTVDTESGRETLGIFGKASLIWNEKLKGYYSVRHDNIETENHDVLDPTRNIPTQIDKYSQSAGVSYQITDPLAVSFDYSNSYRAPALSSLYSNPAFGNTPGLKPEEADDYELGAKWAQTNVEFKTAVFYSEMTNEILFDPLAPNPANTFSGLGLLTNIGQTDRYGFENSLRYRICPNAMIKLGYTFTDAEFGVDSPTRTSFKKDDHVPMVPRDRYSMGLELTPVDRLIINLDMFALSKQVITNDVTNETNGRRLPAYTVFNLTGSYVYKNWRFSATVKNLFDEEYEVGGATSQTSTIPDNFYVPAPGRNYEFRASCSF